ncbi:hypothetical protein [Gilvimarinus agarilyticus]|uniref:hypothetical protein n=1 Tax=Gilvimarinus agarilyticus TaxID=679259 RepID=UPI00059F42EA|nr:hypothetical protein [Gilvimarinus agarilyticus]
MRNVNIVLALCVAGFSPALAGCHGTTPVVEYRERVVPVRVECVDVDALPVAPVYATASVSEQDTIAEVADAYLIERNQLRSHMAELNAVIEGCLPYGD